MSDTPWTTSQQTSREMPKYVTADAMMAYTRITLRNYDADQAEKDAKTATLTLFYHSLWIAVGAVVAAVMVTLGCDVYLSISVGATCSFGQEAWDKIKGTG